MRLVSLQIEIEFAEEVLEYSLEQKVYKAITGKMPQKTGQQTEQNVAIQFPKNKLAVKWDTKSFEAILEQESNINNFIEIVISLLDKINAVAPIGKLSRRNFITYWLLPAPNDDFQALEQKYRETMIVPKPFYPGTFDSSVIFDINTNDVVLHHQSGAMGTSQLLDDYMLFKPDDVPAIFLFLWASTEEKKVVKYSAEEMQNHITTSFKHCKSHSEAFKRFWEEIL